jgi:hypothetical protein
MSFEKLSSYGRFAILLMIVGCLLAIDSIFHLAFVPRLWPLLITVMGIGFIGIFATRGRREALYLTTGINIVCFSGLALWCVFTSWGSLATLWPLFVTFMGIALVCDYFLCQKKKLWLLVGLLLISSSVVFFFVFSISADLWWTVFLLAGVSIWISERAK